MKIRYLGHAAFELTLASGKKLIFDPYESGAYDGALAYGPISGEYDIAVVSHDHADHTCASVTSKAGTVIDTAGEFDVEGVKIRAFETFHDESGGSDRGKNLISIVETEGLRIAHLGDLGHDISAEAIPELVGIDVLIIPVGGYFTIDARAAASIVDTFGPRIVVPMHFKTDKVSFPISPVDEFIGMVDNVEKVGGSEISVSKDDLPESMKVFVLSPSL